MKRGKIRFKPAADADVDEIFAYIAKDNLDSSVRFMQAVYEDAVHLAEMPGAGRMREFQAADLADIRSWPVTGFRNYLIFYRPVEGGILVIRVLHGARDIDAIFDP